MFDHKYSQTKFITDFRNKSSQIISLLWISYLQQAHPGEAAWAL